MGWISMVALLRRTSNRERQPEQIGLLTVAPRWVTETVNSAGHVHAGMACPPLNRSFLLQIVMEAFLTGWVWR
jgi:hypothetical protein